MDETNSPYRKISAFHLPANLLDITIDSLRKEGAAGTVESLVFWVGTVDGDHARVTRVLVPRGQGVYKHPLLIRVSDRIIAALCGFIDPPNIVLLGQVHTHQFDAFHSASDDENSLDTPGYLSVVVPTFASEGAASWEAWAFCECVRSRTFRQMPALEVKKRIIIEAPASIDIHYVTG